MPKRRDITLDDMDRRLLALLQRDTTAPAETLGSKIGLSASSVQRRIKRLRETGTIAREVALLDTDALGKRMTFIVGVKVDFGQKAEVEALQRRLIADPRTQQAYYVTGEVDLVLVVVVEDMQDYDQYSKSLLLASSAMLRFQSNVVIEGLRVGLEVPIDAARPSRPQTAS
ncbi:MAG: Lrp/AsnC family transcriptional regulator [Burkholderiales bacterium]|nr:Lrp/AsnC family transcriptional regulator [Burkholderiales bacterium]